MAGTQQKPRKKTLSGAALQRSAQKLINTGFDLYTFDFGSLDLTKFSDQEKEEILLLFEQTEKLREEYAVKQWFPAIGPYRRELYPKHLEFFAAGKTKTERLFLAGNRCGKSITAAVEMAFHLTGLYPDWWEGHRFKYPIKAYAAGKTRQNTRDICQYKLLGIWGKAGTGTIPKIALAADPVSKPGIPQAYELAQIKHFNAWGNQDGISTLYFRSYDQGMEAFMGTEVDLAWEDEEPDLNVHSEVLTRLMTTSGRLMLTFTPLEGLTEVVRSYLTSDLTPDTSKDHIHVTTCGWDDVPHLSEDQKKRLLSSTPIHLREARSKGIPSIGSGAVYPIDIQKITIEPFELPKFYARAYGMDVGWNRTAALWGALDREADILYIYSEYYQGQSPPAVHASAIKSRGEWIPGICDPAGTNLADGSRMFDQYLAEGLQLTKADKSVEAGIFEVYQRMETGRLKVFNTCTNFFGELRLYQRDERGKVVKQNDHLMDCLRYLAMLVGQVARTGPAQKFSRRSIGTSLPSKGRSVQERWAL